MLPIYSRRALTLVEIVIVVAIIAVTLAIVVPGALKTITVAKKTLCINNLKKLDAAIEQWAIDNNIPPGTQPTDDEIADIYKYVHGSVPRCPSRGVYTIYKIGDNPQVRCSLEDEGHKL